MSQILDPLPSDQSGRILCCYVNATSHIQVARVTNIQNWYFERVVFPGQRLVFEAVSEAILEIHTGMMASAILSDKIPCDRLVVSEGGDTSVAVTSQYTQEDTDNKQNVEAMNNKTRQTADTLTMTSFR